MPTDLTTLVTRLRAAGCVFAEDEAALLLAEADGDALEALVLRRIAGEPLEQVLGWAELGGLRVRLLPGVFVPRQRSLLLVDLAGAAAPAGGTVVDLCCGSGALGALLAHRRADLVVHAADVDPDAVACARLNLLPDRVHEGDLLAALPAELRGQVDVVVANAPYVPSGAIAAMPPEARDHEHRVALDGGDDGLDVHRRLLDRVGAWLAPGGTVLIEVAPAQVATAVGLVERAGLAAAVHDDEDGEPRAVSGRAHP